MPNPEKKEVVWDEDDGIPTPKGPEDPEVKPYVRVVRVEEGEDIPTTPQKLNDIKLEGIQDWWQRAPYTLFATDSMVDEAEAGRLEKEPFIMMCASISDLAKEKIVDIKRLNELKDMFKQYNIIENPEVVIARNYRL